MELTKPVATAVVASVVTAGLVWLAACGSKQSETPVKPGGGDEPVVMAGGSMRFITNDQLTISPDKHKLTHKKKVTMIAVDILHSVNNAPVFETVTYSPPVPITITIYYCVLDAANKCNVEKVTTKLGPAGKMEISADGTFNDPTLNAVDYASVGRITKIDINSNSYECPSDGKGYCFLVIH